ncbi:MAG: helix-turn-helix domain-containing protein [Pseudonocardiaceae bacterium]
MEDRESTIRSRELGDGLRQAMEGAGLKGSQAAHVLGLSQSWVSRLLSGKRGGNALDVAAFLGACRVKSPERDRLLALCQDLNTPGWLQQHGSRLPKQLRTLIDHENKAAAISEFQHSLFTQERPPQFTFYLHEAVLRLPVGGPFFRHAAGGPGRARGARRAVRPLHPDGVRRVPPGDIPGQ